MPPVRYVNATSAELAKEFEDRLLGLPSMTGIFFVAVRADLREDGASTSFIVNLGVSRKVGKGIGVPLVKRIFEKEISEGKQFFVNTTEGSLGPCRDEDSEGPSSVPS